MYSQPELKELVDKALVSLSYDTEAVRLTDPVKYILSVGGKRLRPVMALMACNLFSDKIDDAVMPAAGIEVFHNFTLVHDDIMDQAPVRRGFPTVHKKWNTNQAILSGDVMAFIANECFLQVPQAFLSKVFRIFNKAAIDVCVGQQLDMDYEKVAFISHREYIRMIELKTAVLLAAALKIGALIGGADDRDADLLYEVGRNLGIAFQIQDDMLDVWGDVLLFGKTSGGDIVSNKKSFPLVKAMEIASVPQLKELQKQLSLTDYDREEKVKTVIAIYEQLNIKKITEDLAAGYINRAISQLEKTGAETERKKELTNIAGSLAGRER